MFVIGLRFFFLLSVFFSIFYFVLHISLYLPYRSFLPYCFIASFIVYQWLVCSFLSHVISVFDPEGMLAFLEVQHCPTHTAVPMSLVKQGPVERRTRKYFLAIEEILWDYAPELVGSEVP